MSSSGPCFQDQVENGISELKLLLCLKTGAQERLTEGAYESRQKWREVFWSKVGLRLGLQGRVESGQGEGTMERGRGGETPALRGS